MKTYTLTLTKDQFTAVELACLLYMKIGQGRMEAAFDSNIRCNLLYGPKREKMYADEDMAKLRHIEELMTNVKQEATGLKIGEEFAFDDPRCDPWAGSAHDIFLTISRHREEHRDCKCGVCGPVVSPSEIEQVTKDPLPTIVVQEVPNGQ